MSWKQEIRWSSPSLDFPGTTIDIGDINSGLKRVRDNPDEGNRAVVDKSAIPELEDENGEVYVSDIDDWYVYTLWREDEIEIVLVLERGKEENTKRD